MVNILFVCGYGVGSSAMAASLVERGLKDLKINYKLRHTAAGEALGFLNWADIVVVSKAFIDQIENQFDNIIEIENIMDGEGIALKIYKIVKVKFSDALV